MDQAIDGFMDRRMDGLDGEDLIICLAKWTLYKRWGPLTCDDFRAISIASRNRRRFTSLWGSILDVFGAILGGFGRPTWEPKSTLGRLFFDLCFECVFASIFCRCFANLFNLFDLRFLENIDFT